MTYYVHINPVKREVMNDLLTQNALQKWEAGREEIMTA